MPYNEANVLRKEITLAGRTLSLETGRLAKQAGGAVLARYGDTCVLVVATASKNVREGIDFFPLSVEYEEKMYSVGKIPGGFIKREGRPSEKSILSSRLIDRPIRPLFPDGFRNEVQVVATVLCVEQDNPPRNISRHRRVSRPAYLQYSFCRAYCNGFRWLGGRRIGFEPHHRTDCKQFVELNGIRNRRCHHDGRGGVPKKFPKKSVWMQSCSAMTQSKRSRDSSRTSVRKPCRWD